MFKSVPFAYKPDYGEAEKASNVYLMSLIAIMAGLPLPILNLLATFFFYLGNLRGTYFVRWHCTQALLSQLILLPFNSIAFWWTIGLIFGDETISNGYFAYIITLLMFNLVEFIATIYAAIQTRKGMHIEWWFVGPLTHLICKPR